MKSFLKFGLLASALAASMLAAAHDSTSSLTPNVGVQSSTSVSAYAGTGGGVSLSTAGNTVNAATGGVNFGSAGALGPIRAGSVDIAGTANTTSSSFAGNVSTGNATGAAAASGVAQASIVGVGEFHTVTNGPSGSVSGNAEAVTGTSVTAGTNQFGSISGGASSNFSAGASANQFSLGPIKTANANTDSNALAITTPTVQVVTGGAVVQIQNEAAANAASVAKVGVIQSQSSN